MVDLKKPLLASAVEDLSQIKYPVCQSYKIDGCRMLVKDGVCYSRSMKPFRSKAVQEKFGKPEYNGYDGELVYGFPNDEDVFNKTTSFCMSTEVPAGMKADNIRFLVFDRWDIDAGFYVRLSQIQEDTENNVFVVEHNIVENAKQAEEFETKALSLGYEGVMFRSLDGHYKQGRSTLKEGILLKKKIFQDSEFVVVGFKEKFHNNNEATINELGYTERSSCKENLIPANTLGALVVNNEEFGTFDVGTGFSDALRKEIWDNQAYWLGQIVKVKYFKTDGADYKLPRFPVYLGKRDKDDMGE